MRRTIKRRGSLDEISDNTDGDWMWHTGRHSGLTGVQLLQLTSLQETNCSANCIKITSTQCIQTATWWCCVSVTPKHRLSSNHLKPETCLVFPVFCVSPSSFHCRIWFSLSHLPPHFWLLGYVFPPLLQTSIEPPLSALPCIISQASLSHQCHFYSAGFR